jgi:chemotaxis protein CheZ
VQRKTFRIEAMQRPRAVAPVLDPLAEIEGALSFLLHEGNEKRMTRAAGELAAAVDVMEKATNKILHAAEAIDQCSRKLAADDDPSRAHDIRDQVARIYEACNFQDLAGQRIGKVISTLGLIEDGVAKLIARSTGLGAAAQAKPSPRDLLNGPRLDGDSGHACQRDIDALFS